jgi:hypothetical protein
MTDNVKKITELPACTSPVANNKLLVSGNSDANSFQLTIGTLFGNNVSNVVITQVTPATASSNGKAGTISYDSSWLYVCVANNTWRRIAHATW